MTGLFAILIGTALADNAVLTHLLGLDPALRTQTRLRDAAWLALAIGCLLLIAAVVCWLIERFVLSPFDLDWLRSLVWLLVAAALSPWPRMMLQHRVDATTMRALAPPLIIGNGLLLGALALSAQSDFVSMLVRAFGIAVGFGTILPMFTAMHDRLEGAAVPPPFRGAPILLITAAIVALAFMGFAGVGR